MQKKKKKKLIIIISILGGLFLLIGVFWLGKISAENKQIEKKDKPSPLNPQNPSNKKEWKVVYLGMTFDKNKGRNYAVFSNTVLFQNESDLKTFYINENVSRINQLLNKGKLKEKNQFIIICEKELENNVRHFFEEDGQNLEIKEV